MHRRIVIQQRDRFIREGLAWALHREPDLEVVAAIADQHDLVDTCARTKPDVVLLTADDSTHDVESVVAAIQRHRRETRVAVLCSNERVAASCPNCAEAVSAGAGMSAVLQAARSTRRTAAPARSAMTLRRGNGGVLTPREVEVLGAVAGGCTTREIGGQLGISPKTVENHKQRIFSKLDVQNQAHAVAIALRRGLLSVADTTRRADPA